VGWLPEALGADQCGNFVAARHTTIDDPHFPIIDHEQFILWTK
jgi:hypothetical protein